MNKSLLTITLAAFAGTAFSHGATLASFSDDFEGADPGAGIIGNGWKIFGNALNSSGDVIYGYGVFDAPNGTPGFSSITTTEAGPPQGVQGLVVYSDYNNGDHGNGLNIEANVFQEQIIPANAIGLHRFTFDAKKGDLVDPSTALAFIKVLDPNNGFSLTKFETFDTTNLPVEWGTYSVDVNPFGLDGQILQFGFLATATNFNASGVFYDNVEFGFIPEPSSALLLGLSGLALLGRRRR